jgi:hypothetical protein
MVRPDQYDVGEAIGDQPDTPQKEGAYQNLTQLRISLNEIEESVPIDLDELPCLTDSNGDESRPPRENRYLSSELSGAQGSHAHAAVLAQLHSLDCSREHNVEVSDRSTALDQHFACVDLSAATVS